MTFFDWMLAHYAEDMNNIRLKVLEYIIWGEKKAFEAAQSIMIQLSPRLSGRRWPAKTMKNSVNGSLIKWSILPGNPGSEGKNN